MTKPRRRSDKLRELLAATDATQGAQSLREQLKAGYLANADENLKIAAEWFPLEEEA